jgi:hypothetical protein
MELVIVGSYDNATGALSKNGNILHFGHPGLEPSNEGCTKYFPSIHMIGIETNVKVRTKHCIHPCFVFILEATVLRGYEYSEISSCF